MPPERVGVVDHQLELLAAATETAMDDERDVEMALREDREGIGAAASLELNGPGVRAGRAVRSRRMKLLLVSLYFPPAGGGGVQRPLKFAQYLPALGIETHVLAPEGPKWIHEDEELRAPTQAWVHRARYVGPRGRKPAEELHGTEGLSRALVHARLASRRLLVPDEAVTWNLTAIPAAIRIARSERVDAVLTTSPPGSVHLVGAAVKRATGAKWVADLRDSLVAHPHRRDDGLAVRAEGEGRATASRGGRALGRRDHVRLRRDRRGGAELRAARTRGHDLERLRLRRLRRARLRAGRAVPDHAHRQLLRPARPAAVPHGARRVGPRRRRPLRRRLPLGRPRVRRGPGLGDRLELIPYAPRRRALELQRDSDALLLLIPDAGGRGRGVLSGKVFEYLAAERPILAAVPPDGAAAGLIGRPARASSRRPTTSARSRRPSAAWSSASGTAACLRSSFPRARVTGCRGRRAPRSSRNCSDRYEPPAMSRPGRVTDFLFFATIFTVTFAKLQWEVAGTLSLSDVLTAFFLVAFVGTRLAAGDRRLAYGAVVAAGFFCLFLLVYLIGFFNLETQQALEQWAKGLVKFLLHFLFLVAGIAYLARRTEAFYWRTLAVFMAGIAANAVYGIVQLAAAEVADVNLDQSVLQPITGGASSINIFGAIEGRSVFRPNALTGDPNHLGIELILPLLVLTPIYLRLERGHRLRLPLAAVLSFLLVWSSRRCRASGLLGLGVGLLVLALPYRRLLVSRQLLLPLGRRRRRRSSRSSRRSGTSSRPCSARAWTRRERARRRTSTSTASSPTCSRRIRCSGSG